MKLLITLLAVLCAGCATGTPSMHSMNNYDLNYFQYDCARSREQIAFLNSLRLQGGQRVKLSAQRLSLFEAGAGI